MCDVPFFKSGSKTEHRLDSHRRLGFPSWSLARPEKTVFTQRVGVPELVGALEDEQEGGCFEYGAFCYSWSIVVNHLIACLYNM